MMKKVKLGELVNVTRGTSLAGKFYSEEGKLVRLTLGNFNLNGGGFKHNTSKTNLFYKGIIKDEYILQEGDIITPLTEQAVGLLGTTARIPVSNRYIQSQDIALVKCKNDLLHPNFCYYLISSDIVKQQLNAAAQQTKIRHTSPSRIMDCNVWIPNYTEQKNIGNFLRNIDEKISINRQINHNLEAMAKQLYDYWFVQFDFPDENGKPYKSSGGKMVWNEKLKREIPEGWNAKILENIVYITNGATPSTTNQDNYNGDIIWITPKDLSEQKSKFIDNGQRSISKKGYDSCSTTLLPKGTILLSSRAPIGLLSIAKKELCTNQGFKNLVPKDKGITNFLYYYIKRHIPQIQQLGTGTTFKEISKNDLNSFPILEVKNKTLYSTWDKVSESIFLEQYELTKEINRLTKLRDELLPLLMNGQATVNYDLSDD